MQDWDISFGDTVADNASAGPFVLGDQPRTLDQVEPRTVSMTMTLRYLGEAESPGSRVGGTRPMGTCLGIRRRITNRCRPHGQEQGSTGQPARAPAPEHRLRTICAQAPPREQVASRFLQVKESPACRSKRV